MTIRKMGFIRRQKYKVYMYIERWLDRKVIETENRELTYLETTMLIFGYCVWKIDNPY